MLSPKAGTLQPGNSHNSFQKRLERASDLCASSGAEDVLYFEGSAEDEVIDCSNFFATKNAIL
jgi:hypothetical protein